MLPQRAQYASKSTTVLRGALKEPARTTAMAREAVTYNRNVFVNGKPQGKSESVLHRALAGRLNCHRDESGHELGGQRPVGRWRLTSCRCSMVDNVDGWFLSWASGSTPQPVGESRSEMKEAWAVERGT